MLRTIIIHDNNAEGVLLMDVDPDMSQGTCIMRIKAAINDLKETDPGKYNALLENGAFPWRKLYSDMPAGILARRGLIIFDYQEAFIVNDSGRIRHPGQNQNRIRLVK